MIVVTLIALSSATLFAVGSSLQHRSAGSAPDGSKRQMMRTLLRRPGWLAGALLCAAAFGLHAVALSQGDLSLVQPIILSGIVFAVLARSAIDRRLPSRGELGWAVVTWAGLGLFIAVLRPSAGRPPDDQRALALIGIGLILVAGLALTAGRCVRRPLLRGALLAVASGISFGLVAGLVKLTTTEADAMMSVLTHWSTWLLIGVGAVAVLLNQRAYQATRLSVSAPVLNVCQLMVSLSFGLIVFGERLFATPPILLAEVVGLAVMVLGVTRLAGRATEQPPPASESPSTRENDVPSLDAVTGSEHQHG
jgi:hypothetical protein